MNIHREKVNYFSYLSLKCSSSLSPKTKLNIVTKAIEEAKERWGKRGVTLKLGIEADYFIGCEGELKELEYTVLRREFSD